MHFRDTAIAANPAIVPRAQSPPTTGHWEGSGRDPAQNEEYEHSAFSSDRSQTVSSTSSEGLVMAPRRRRGPGFAALQGGDGSAHHQQQYQAAPAPQAQVQTNYFPPHSQPGPAYVPQPEPAYIPPELSSHMGYNVPYSGGEYGSAGVPAGYWGQHPQELQMMAPGRTYASEEQHGYVEEPAMAPAPIDYTQEQQEGYIGQRPMEAREQRPRRHNSRNQHSHRQSSTGDQGRSRHSTSARRRSSSRAHRSKYCC